MMFFIPTSLVLKFHNVRFGQKQKKSSRMTGFLLFYGFIKKYYFRIDVFM